MDLHILKAVPFLKWKFVTVEENVIHLKLRLVTGSTLGVRATPNYDFKRMLLQEQLEEVWHDIKIPTTIKLQDNIPCPAAVETGSLTLVEGVPKMYSVVCFPAKTSKVAEM